MEERIRPKRGAFCRFGILEMPPSGSSPSPIPLSHAFQEASAFHTGRLNPAIPSRRNSTHRSRRESTADGESLSSWNDHPHRGRGEPRAWPTSGPTGEMLRRGQDGEKRGRGRAWAAGRQGTNVSLPHLQTAGQFSGGSPFFFSSFLGKKGRVANWRLKS